MKITISPCAGIAGETETAIYVTGDTLYYDGTAFDFSDVPEGGEVNPDGDHPFIGPITRKRGEIHCTVHARFDPATAEHEQPRDPAHWVDVVDEGPVCLRVVRKNNNPAAEKWAEARVVMETDDADISKGSA